MEISVQGIRITLTAEQILIIENEQKEREKCRGSFSKMLKRFGFKKMDNSDWNNKDVIPYQHTSLNWYAEIIDYGNYSAVWMVGQHLKHSSSGGWVYWEPQEIEIALIDALEKI